MFSKSVKTKILISFGLIVFFASLIFFFFSGGNFELLKSLFVQEHSNEELRDKLADFGFRGYITIALLSMLQIVFTFLPAEPIQVLSGITFGFPIGLACCMAGVILGNSLIFFLYKTYGNRIRQYFVKNLNFDFEKTANSARVTLVIFILYLLPVIPYGMICFFAASIGMKYHRYITVTLLGSIPSVCIGVALGHITIAYSWVLSLSVAILLVILLIVITIKRAFIFTKINEFADKPRYSSKKTVKKCNPFLLAIVYNSLRFYYRLCGIKISATNKYGKEIESPSIVLCNHGSFIDFIYAERLIRKKKPNFIVARLYFYEKRLGTILWNLGCFPKSMFATDLESTKNCMRVLKSGSVLAMMPEARLSTVGRFEDIQERTYSFLKKSNVPVYSIKINGDYLADPKWGKGMRRGATVEAELDILFTAEEIKENSIEEIKAKVEQRLRYDEFEWLNTKPELSYKSKRLAEGLENILTRCPICGQKYSLYTKGHDVFCEKCGKLTTLDNRYAFSSGFTFSNFAEWYDWQKGLLESEIAGNEDYSLVSNVELRLPSLDGKTLTRSAGKGVCTLDRNGLEYVGTRDGEDYKISFPIEQIYRLLFGAGKNFEVYNESEILYFVPEEKRSAVEWYMASMIIHDMTSNKKAST